MDCYPSPILEIITSFKLIYCKYFGMLDPDSFTPSAALSQVDINFTTTGDVTPPADFV